MARSSLNGGDPRKRRIEWRVIGYTLRRRFISSFEKTFYLLLLEITILAIIPIWATGCGGRAGNGDDTGVVVKLLCVFSTNPCQEHQILAFYYKDPSSPAFSTHFFIESGFRDMTWIFIPKVIKRSAYSDQLLLRITYILGATLKNLSCS